MKRFARLHYSASYLKTIAGKARIAPISAELRLLIHVRHLLESTSFEELEDTLQISKMAFDALESQSAPSQNSSKHCLNVGTQRLFCSMPA